MVGVSGLSVVQALKVFGLGPAVYWLLDLCAMGVLLSACLNTCSVIAVLR